jgi:hypothetical protein
VNTRPWHDARPPAIAMSMREAIRPP